MKKRSMRAAVHSRGSALLIVLALLLLLTTLSVAFLSRATFERQLSNASYGQGKVDLAGQGAINAIIGDLQQEIVAGSTGSTSTPTLASGFYYPNAPSTAVPAVVGFTPAIGLEDLLKISYRSTSFWPNSANYNNTAGPIRAAAVSTGTASLNGRSVTNTRWNKPLLLAPTSSSSYAPVSSNFVPPDWIYIARDGSNPTTWSSSFEYLPSIAPTTATGTTVGANPVTQRYAYAIYDEGSTLDLNTAGSLDTSNSAVTYSANQPYKNALAYADLTQLPYLSTTAQTVAGASGTTLSTTLSAANQQAFVNAVVGWRNFASAGLTSSNVFPNTYTVAAANTTAFDQNVLFNPSGFLSVGSYNPLANSNLSPSKSGLAAGANFQGQSSYQSDNAFASRQQLLQFFLVNLGQNTTFTGKVSLTALVNVLPYFGTFSRDISQPSYASPVSFANSTAPTLSNNTGTGGNSVSTASGYSSSVDALINPAFLNVTVGSNSGTSGWTRNNGTTAIAGEPLVKKRFALMRLAWLTYKGPSASRNGVATGTTLTTTTGGNGAPDGADYDIAQMENTYGIPASFLAQGTAQNIYNYFGLSWVPDPNNSGSSEWAYSHSGAYATSSSSGSILTSATSLTSAAILTLPSVAGLSSTLAREPDFFELLKAGLCVGSIGKAYNASWTATAALGTLRTPSGSPADYYAQRDQDVDNSIIQIGANIISQYQPSGFPARILFDDGLFGAAYQEHRGVVDLPYIYQVQESKMRLSGQDSTPTYTSLPVTTNSSNSSGKCVDLQIPVIWNPHAWTSTSDNSDGNPRPTSFRIYAETCAPTYDATGLSPDSTKNISIETQWRSALGTGGPASNGYYPSTDSGTAATTAASLTLTNTEMDFNIPQSTTAASDYNYLFREPTLLNKPSIPSGSGLAVGSGHTIKSAPFSSTYITSRDAAGEYPASGTGVDNTQYIGVVLSGANTLPLAWKETLPADAINNPSTSNNSTPSPTASTACTVPAEMTTVVSGSYVTYRLQYKDPNGNWITYDEKYAPIVCANSYNPWQYLTAGYGLTFNDNAITGEVGATCFDPRTGRWGMNYIGRNGLRGQSCEFFAPAAGTSTFSGWAVPVSGSSATTANAANAAAQNAIWTLRPDEYQGISLGSYNGFANAFCHDTGPLAAGWYPAPYNSLSVDSVSNDAGYSIAVIRPGLVCQNNIGVYAASSTGTTAMYRYSGDSNPTAGPTATLPSPQPLENTGTAFYLGCFADPDGVVRRGMAAYVPPVSWLASTSGLVASASAAAATTPAASGIPLKPAYTFPTAGSASLTAGPELASRPIMLNRPFRSVADIGYVFSDTPWRNLDFSTPESGNPGFLDIFCINDTNDPNGLVAGKVDLNTRQAPVLQAILAGAYKDAFSATYGSGTVPVLPGSSATASQATASVIAAGLVSRTSGGNYLVNIGDLVGKWSSSVTNTTATSPTTTASSNNIDGSQSYVGFSGTSATTSTPSSSPQNLSSLLYSDLTSNGTVAAYDTNNVNRMREAAIRALANCGTTRVWNLMIDVIAQTGRFPTSASSLANFNVEGERRYWVHVALDRYTGKVLDEQIEEVKE